MANPHGDLKPGGQNQRELVQLLAMLTYSLEGLCQKLDNDTGSAVALATYEANCYIAKINTIIEDCVGNRRGQFRAEHHFYEISPGGLTDQALLEWMYNYFDAIQTLTEQLDADNMAVATYEADVYEEHYTAIVENQDGNSIGNGTDYYFRPGGLRNAKAFTDGLYNAVDAWGLLCAMLTSDANADDDYTALWYTATILLRVEDTLGNVIGNDRTDMKNS